MAISIVTWVAIALVILLLSSLSVKVASQGDELVVERLGKFKKVLKPGLHFIIPFIDRVRAHVNMRQQMINLSKQKVITKDNVTTDVDGVVFFKVIDSPKMIYGITNLETAIEQLAMTNLRAIMGKLTLDEALSSRDVINAELLKALDEITDAWGTKVTRVEIQEISPPDEIQHAMSMQMKAERERRATVLKAEGEREAAEKQAEARERLAKAEANAIKFVSETVAKTGETAAKYFIAKDYVEALEQLARSSNAKYILIPHDVWKTLEGLLGNNKNRR